MLLYTMYTEGPNEETGATLDYMYVADFIGLSGVLLSQVSKFSYLDERLNKGMTLNTERNA